MADRFFYKTSPLTIIIIVKFSVFNKISICTQASTMLFLYKFLYILSTLKSLIYVLYFLFVVIIFLIFKLFRPAFFNFFHIFPITIGEFPITEGSNQI